MKLSALRFFRVDECYELMREMRWASFFVYVAVDCFATLELPTRKNSLPQVCAAVSEAAVGDFVQKQEAVSK